MQAESGAGDAGDGRDGFDPMADTWLPRDEIELILRREVSAHKKIFPKAEKIYESWNCAVFERGWWLWKQRDVILVHVNGYVENVSVRV